MNYYLAFILVGLLIVSAGACSKPAPNAGFIQQTENLSKPKTLPFHKAWVKPNVKFDKYSKIIIAPVDTTYILKSSWVAEVKDNREKIGEVKKDINALAKYTRESVVQSFRNDPKKRLQVVSKRADNTLLLEMALVEATPSNTVRGALETIPHPGIKVFGKLTNDSSVAFEARVKDAQTNKILATFADRETKDVRLLDTRQFSMFGAVESIVDNWAEQFVAIANKMPDEVVSDPFPLQVW